MMAVCIKVHALAVTSMLISVNMDTLVFAPMYFYCFMGNVGNVAVTRKRLHCQRAYILCLIYCSFRKS